MENQTIGKHKIALVFRIFILMMGVFGLLMYFWAVPEIGKWIVELSPDYSKAYYPWLIFIWITGVPCYLVLVYAWKVSDHIVANTVFSRKAASYFRAISRLAVIDSAFFLLVNLIYLVLDINHPSVVIAAFFVTFIGAVFSFCMKLGADYIGKAAELQEENDLTI